MKYVKRLALFALLSLCSAEIQAQQQSVEDLLATQRKELLPLQRMDGVWRGNAWTILPDGKKLEMVQTERVGSMFDGAVKVIEGRHEVNGGQRAKRSREKAFSCSHKNNTDLETPRPQVQSGIRYFSWAASSTCQLSFRTHCAARRRAAER
jgi:hypothetical protein